MVVLAIGVFGIGDSNSEIVTSSTDTADDCPSSYIRLPISELSSDTPPTAEMNLEDCLWAMEEELMKHWMKSDAIEISLQAILDKLNILLRKEDIMQSESDFGKLESKECLRDSQRKADGGTANMLTKVKPAMPADFDGDREKGHAFFNTGLWQLWSKCNIFPSDQSQIHWVLSFFKSDQAACFANKVLRSESKGKGHYFQNWEAFEKAFLDQFCPKNEQLTALTKLKGTSWYQGKDLVDNYIDWFQELIDLAECDDDKTIVIKFQCGLDPVWGLLMVFHQKPARNGLYADGL